METLENTINIENEDKRIGSNFLGILNDIKRRPEDIAKELNINLNLLKNLDGKPLIPFDIVQIC